MTERYIAFDVETPNSRNDRMSSIGIAVVEAGEIVESFYSLVNPECEFHYYNVALTEITPEMVRDKPTFPELWEKIEPIMSSGVLVAHNAPFDMSVLAKCLRDYGIVWKRRAEYCCTVRMAKNLMPWLDNHKLNTLCYELDIALEHHDAGSDARACAEILRYLLPKAEIRKFAKQYDMLAVCTCKK